MNDLAAESDAEVPQTLHACSAPLPASLLTVPSIGGAIDGVRRGEGDHSAEPELN